MLSVRARQVLVIFSFLLFFATLDTLHMYLAQRGEGLSVDLLYFNALVFWVPYFIAVPGVLLLVDRCRFESWRSALRSLSIHAIAGLVFAYSNIWVNSIMQAPVKKIPFRQEFFYLLELSFTFDYLGYCGMAVIAYSVQYYAELARRQSEARLEERVQERMRIARELHDTLLQSLHGLLFRFQAARNMLPHRPEEAMDALDGAIARTEQAIAESQDAITDLRPGSVTDNDLDELLRAVGKDLESAENGNVKGIPPRFSVIVEGERQTLSPILQAEVYRIARELLRNSFRHACACQVEAEVRYGPEHLRLRIRDDGKGLDPEVLMKGGRQGHWGLPGVKERAKQIGAQVEFWSEAGAGTEVQFSIPAAIAYTDSADRPRFKFFRRVRVDEH